MRAWSSAHGKPPLAVYELGTAAEDSNRRAVIPGWRRNLLGRSGAEGDPRARFDFPGHDGPLKPQAVGAGLGGLFCLGALQADGGFRAALLLLLSGGINDGVAESHRCVAIATPRAPPTSPRAAPNARGFFCIRPRAGLFVSKWGNKGAPCRVNSPRAPSMGPANRKKE
jgi:hypothetical protein